MEKLGGEVLHACMCVWPRGRGDPSERVCDQREDERHVAVLRWGKGVLACGPILREQELWLLARASLDQGCSLALGAALQVPLHRSSWFLAECCTVKQQNPKKVKWWLSPWLRVASLVQWKIKGMARLRRSKIKDLDKNVSEGFWQWEG